MPPSHGQDYGTVTGMLATGPGHGYRHTGMRTLGLGQATWPLVLFLVHLAAISESGMSGWGDRGKPARPSLRGVL